MRVLAAALGLLLGMPWSVASQEPGSFVPIDTPAGPGAREPALFASGTDRLIMTWTEEDADGFAVRLAALENGVWSSPVTVVSSPDLFVNWADFPSVAGFADGTLLVHWLQGGGGSAYAYDINLAVSRDDGASWSAPIVPHRDATSSQHGFVSLLPFGETVVAVWLDGRAYDGDLLEAGAVPGAMQLRSTVISSDGRVGADVPLDLATCSCCQTAAAIAGEAVVVAYRDLREGDIRDISTVRFEQGVWSAPVPVHDDGWEISGCPVNGPSISAHDERVVVAWFTAADDEPAVKIAFSANAGASFGEPVRIDLGRPVGRVDTLMLEDGSALISWVEWRERQEVLLVCRATAEGCGATGQVAVNTSTGSLNFPQIAATREGVYLAWTQPLADGSDAVRMVRFGR